MKFKMNPIKVILIGGAMVALTATIAFAAFTQTLNITGSTTTLQKAWDIGFADSAAGNIGTGTVAFTGTGATGNAASIDGTGKSLTGINVTLPKPGDKGVYSLVIKNSGTAAGYLNSINIAASEITSGAAPEEGWKTDEILYSISVGTENDPVKVTSTNCAAAGNQNLGTLISAGESVPVTVEVEWKNLPQGGGNSVLTNDVALNLGDITITIDDTDTTPTPTP